MKRIINALWGDLHRDEFYKFMLLAAGMFFIIGSYWPVKALKDSIFVNMVGPDYIPNVKILSTIAFFFLVLGYSKLVDLFSREKIVYVLISLFTLIGLGFVFFLSHPTIGVANTVAHPRRMLGWLFYIFAESYVSISVALLWSYINDVTTPESAKKGYGMIIFGSQLGGFLAMLASTYLANDVSRYTTMVPIVVISSMVMLFMMVVVVFLLNRVVSKEELKGYTQQESEERAGYDTVGFLDGLRVLVTRPYVAGIFSLVFFYEAIGTIMQYQMLVLAKSTYINAALVNRFVFNFGLAVQLIACLFGLFGTSFFQRTFGIRFCLLAFPLLLAGSIISYMFMPTLFAITCVVIVAKAFNYALNQPAKEVLYIPTTKDIKYKAKAWIDMFGARFAKSGGSLVNMTVGPVVHMTGFIALGAIAVWFMLANMLGKTFTKISKAGKVID